MRSRLVTALIALLIPAQLSGQETDAEEEGAAEPTYELVADRPRVTQSAVTVPPMRVQLEAGFMNVEQSGLSTVSIPTLLARFSPISRLEVRLGAAYLRRSFNSNGTVDGLGDVTIGTKVQLLGSHFLSPKVALIVELASPVGSEGVSPEGMGGRVILSAANQFGSLSFGGNLGIAAAEGERPAGLYALTYSSGIAGNVGGFLEVFGSVASGRLPEHSFNAGTTILLLRNLQIDLANAFALSDAAPGTHFTVGVTWRLPR